MSWKWNRSKENIAVEQQVAAQKALIETATAYADANKAPDPSFDSLTYSPKYKWLDSGPLDIGAKNDPWHFNWTSPPTMDQAPLEPENPLTCLWCAAPFIDEGELNDHEDRCMG